MTVKSILLRLLNIKGAKVDGIDFEDDAAMTVHVHLARREQWRCPVCGRRCGVYDHATTENFWRGMDFGPMPVRIGARLPRVNCPAHGVLTARVPWADVDAIKRSKYALGKNPESLTKSQQERLELIQAEDPQIRRGHDLKEKLRLILKLKDPELAEEGLDGWLGWAQRCRIPAFVELGRKVRRHREHILDTVRYGLSNARIEATNNKIKLLIRIAYGFRNIDAMIGLIMLFCSSIEIPWPGRTAQKPVK